MQYYQQLFEHRLNNKTNLINSRMDNQRQLMMYIHNQTHHRQCLPHHRRHTSRRLLLTHNKCLNQHYNFHLVQNFRQQHNYHYKEQQLLHQFGHRHHHSSWLLQLNQHYYMFYLMFLRRRILLNQHNHWNHFLRQLLLPQRIENQFLYVYQCRHRRFLVHFAKQRSRLH